VKEMAHCRNRLGGWLREGLDLRSHCWLSSHFWLLSHDWLPSHFWLPSHCWLHVCLCVGGGAGACGAAEVKLIHSNVCHLHQHLSPLSNGLDDLTSILESRDTINSQGGHLCTSSRGSSEVYRLRCRREWHFDSGSLRDSCSSGSR
jgi:hypothetical protein